MRSARRKLSSENPLSQLNRRLFSNRHENNQAIKRIDAADLPRPPLQRATPVDNRDCLQPRESLAAGPTEPDRRSLVTSLPSLPGERISSRGTYGFDRTPLIR
jgi:hypothetical protein